ncbi:MAG TPA: hypothetical protein VNT42_03295 [Sphingomonas sp.]|nr:hypothetical protein [Sphingomonas sp.]
MPELKMHDRADPWAGAAKVARIIGAFGTVGLVFMIGLSLWIAHQNNVDSGCFDEPLRNVDAAPAISGGIRITGIQPHDLELNHTLCVAVENVVPAEKQAELAARVTIAARAVADANIAYQAAALARNASPTEQTQAQTGAADAAQVRAKADLAVAQAALDEAQKGRTIVLYVNGKPSPLTAIARPIAGPQTLTFEIAAPEDANSATAAYWRALLAAPASKGRIALRIGLAEQGQPAPLVNLGQVNVGGARESVTFLLYTPWLMYCTGAALAAILLGLLGLAYQTTLLRVGTHVGDAYSLALVQMAVWLVLTTAGFIYIWLVTGQYLNVFTPGLFVLVGISGATATASQLLNRGQQAPRSNGFFYDIAGAWQGGEVQLQRLQIIAWTVILALIFCWNVIAQLTLTSFDANLLVLTGIANGVYVSLKPQETRQQDAR